MALEQGDNVEARSFVPSSLSDRAGLSRSVQDFYQPIVNSSVRQDLPWALDFETGADLYQSAAYTGERLSARATMVDDVEQKLDAPKIQPPSDAAQREGQFTDTNKQETWMDATEGNRTTQKDSATMEALSDARIAEIKAAGGFQKFELFDSTAQAPPSDQVLLASNITPNVPSLEQSQQYPDIQRVGEQPKIAQYSDGYMPPPTLVPSLEQLGITPETARALALAAAELVGPWMKDHPLADRENEIMAHTTRANPQAWEDAKAAFPQLSNIPANIMRAYTRNEIANYDRFDLKDDLDAASGKVNPGLGRPADQATLGISQISPKGVREFEERYPQFKQFLESKGYTGPGHELAALLDRECAPMIIAAKTASVVEDMQKHGISNPTSEQLAYAYNPDVYSYPDGHGGRVFKAMYHPEIELSKTMHPDQRKEYYPNDPRVLSASQHVRNVMNHLK